MTKNKVGSHIVHTIIVAIVGFALQLVWEYAQCGYFYVMDTLTGHTRLMLSATIGDMNMSVILLWILIVVNKDKNWLIAKWNLADYALMIFYALFLSFYFEIHALHTGRWGYNVSTMPLIPNTPIGLVPVIQLLILFPVIFILSRKLLQMLQRNKV